MICLLVQQALPLSLCRDFMRVAASHNAACVSEPSTNGKTLKSKVVVAQPSPVDNPPDTATGVSQNVPLSPIV